MRERGKRGRYSYWFLVNKLRFFHDLAKNLRLVRLFVCDLLNFDEADYSKAAGGISRLLLVPKSVLEQQTG
jgi:hypothetical protein